MKNSLRLGTANFNNPDTIATTCVFLPDENAPGWGDHAGDKQKFQDNEELCHCHHLYNGEVAPWGCLWFQLWLQKTTIAARRRFSHCFEFCDLKFQEASLVDGSGFGVNGVQDRGKPYPLSPVKASDLSKLTSSHSP